MSKYPLSAYTENVEDVLDAAKVLADTIGGLTIYQYGGTSVEALYKLMPQVQPPALVIGYDRSDYYTDKCRRIIRFHAIVVVRAPKDPYTEGVEVWSDHVQSVIGVLDGVLLKNDAFCEAVSDEAVDLGPTLACVDIIFRVRDH